MKAELTFSDHAVDLHITVKEWLVRKYGAYSVGELSNGHLVVVTESGAGKSSEPHLFEAYEYEDFDAMSEADGIGIQAEVPASLIRAVAHALGITHVEFDGNSYPVDEYFVSDEYDVLKDIEYPPQLKLVKG